jgi:putative hydrolase of the HAD superfamily
MEFKHIRHIFLDLDNTIWDFSGNSRRILQEIYLRFDLATHDIQQFEHFHHHYHLHNSLLWKAYKQGSRTKEEVRNLRFRLALHDLGIPNSYLSDQLADYYIEHTKQVKDLVPGAMEVLTQLSERYPLHIITNGFDEVQFFKINNSGIGHFFQTVTTAESAGVLKPDPIIFQTALQSAGSKAEESLYIGDSPEADGHGALDVGMEFIWFNYTGEENTYSFKHTVDSLPALLPLLNGA